jgi:hypothetical protein
VVVEGWDHIYVKRAPEGYSIGLLIDVFTAGKEVI